MAALGTVISLLGTASTVIGNNQAGAAAETNAASQALQLRANAGVARAQAQREAINQERQTKFMLSRAQALAAASGGRSTDPTIVNLEGNIAGEGEYRRLAAIYNGEAQATGNEYQAEVTQRQGQTVNQATNTKSLSTVLSAGSSYYQKYGTQFTKPSPVSVSDPGMANADIKDYSAPGVAYA